MSDLESIDGDSISISKKTTKATKATKTPVQASDNGFFDFIMEFVKAEIRKPEMKDEVLKPLLKWVLWNLMPYLFLFLGLNFFFTMIAVLLVMVFIRK